MARKIKKYYYNTHTHQFEKFRVPVKVKVLWIAGLVCAVLLTSFLLVWLSWWVFESPRERMMSRDLEAMNRSYQQLQRKYIELEQSLKNLEEKDDHVYRAIFEAAPIHLTDKPQKTFVATTDSWENARMLRQQLLQKVQDLEKRIHLQQRSLDTINQYVQAKEEMLASIPAIIPVSYNQLGTVASGFGYRIDPVYKTPKLHAGIDFAGRSGTPIYATANGRVQETAYEEAGYGHHVIINHGYGYQTLYAHMSKIKSRKGQQVQRGEVIGYMGSTGKSTGPHCHYEVHKNGEKINPVHFFYNDLTPTDYERIIAQASIENQSFD